MNAREERGDVFGHAYVGQRRDAGVAREPAEAAEAG